MTSEPAPTSLLPRTRARGFAGVALAAALATAGARADDGFAPVTPYRPSVSNPAQLSAPGQLELELGGLRARADGARRDSVPYLLKLAFDPAWGLLLGGEARVWQRDADGSARGVGDTAVTLKRAWVVDAATAFGAELGVKLPTAAAPIGSGRADESLNTLYSRDLGAWHLDANLNATRIGRPEPGSARTQLGASASLSVALDDEWSLGWELSGTRRSGVPSQTQALAALSWSPSKFLTLDAGVARAPHPAPATTQVFVGAVMPLARLW